MFRGTCVGMHAEKRSRRRKLLYPHPKLSLGLVPPIGLYSKVDVCTYVYVACKKNDVRIRISYMVSIYKLLPNELHYHSNHVTHFLFKLL